MEITSAMLDASFRGASFFIQSVTDRYEHAVAVHEYPGRAGAAVEDLGWKARIVPIQAVFWGKDYQDKLDNLVKALKQPGPGEMIHPVFGSLNVTIRSWSVAHDAERHDYVTVTFEAVETGEPKSLFNAHSTRAKAQAKRATLLEKLSGALRDVAQQLRSTLDAVRAEARKARAEIRKIRQELADLVEPFVDVYKAGMEVADAVSEWIREAQNCIDAVEKAIDDVRTGVDAAVSGYHRFVKMAERFPRTALKFGQKPAAYAGGNTAASTAWASGPAAGRAEAVPAVPVPAAAAVPRETPEPGSARTPRGVVATYIQIRQTVFLATELQDILMAQLDKPELTPQEVESMVGNVRERVQDCMDFARAALPEEVAYEVCENLREVAETLQGLAQQVLRTQPALVAVTAERECSFSLLAHALYGDYTRAAELARINPQIKNPNFIAKGQELLAYAQ